MTQSSLSSWRPTQPSSDTASMIAEKTIGTPMTTASSELMRRS